MNTDELKIITEMVSLLSVQGKEAFIWFLAIKYGLPSLQWLILFPAFLFTIIKIVIYINYNSKHESALLYFRDLLCPNRFSGVIKPSEINAMEKEIHKLLDDSTR